MKYDNEYELIYMVRQHDDEALRLLMQNYEVSVRCVIAHFNKRKDRIWSWDDYRQEAMIKLLQAIEYYQEDGDASFSSFYVEIFRRFLIDRFRNKMSYKGICEAQSQSLEVGVYDNEAQYNVLDYFAVNPCHEHEVHERIHAVKKELTPLEKRIVDMRVAGYSYAQISSELGIRQKKVDNTLHKVRSQDSKMQKEINDELT